jgi:hypothetical protein
VSDEQRSGNGHDERVGYCSPPKHSRFKPGNRANPNGRGGRNRDDFAESVQETRASRVVLREGAKTRIVTRSEANIVSLFDRAKRGNIAAAIRLLDLIEFASRAGHGGPTTVEIINGLPNAAGEYADSLILEGGSKLPEPK